MGSTLAIPKGRLARRIAALCLVAICIAGHRGAASAAASQVAVDADLDEGPHLRWVGDGAAVALRVEDGRAVTKPVTVHEGAAVEVCAEPTGTPCATIDREPPRIEPWRFDGVERVIAIGDLHGQYEAARRMLAAAGVIDADGGWDFGRGHLVFCGDVVDRGRRTTEVLWMIYRLEQEAAAAGGRVHLLLGNHEIMIMQGDLRYVHERCMEAAGVLGIDYDDLVGADMELGRWLRSKHAIVRIDDTAFVHGGIGPTFTGVAAERGWSIGDVNRLARELVDGPGAAPRDVEQLTAAAQLFGADGPFWYRGYLIDEQRFEPATRADVERALAWLGAARVVVAHTEMPRITTRFGGLVVAIDLPIEDRAEALLIEAGRGMFRLTADGSGAPLE